MLCSQSKKDSRRAGLSAFTSDRSRFLKELLESYGMAMVSILVSSNLFFIWFAFPSFVDVLPCLSEELLAREGESLVLLSRQLSSLERVRGREGSSGTSCQNVPKSVVISIY